MYLIFRESKCPISLFLFFFYTKEIHGKRGINSNFKCQIVIIWDLGRQESYRIRPLLGLVWVKINFISGREHFSKTVFNCFEEYNSIWKIVQVKNSFTPYTM